MSPACPCFGQSTWGRGSRGGREVSGLIQLLFRGWGCAEAALQPRGECRISTFAGCQLRQVEDAELRRAKNRENKLCVGLSWRGRWAKRHLPCACSNAAPSLHVQGHQEPKWSLVPTGDHCPLRPCLTGLLTDLGRGTVAEGEERSSQGPGEKPSLAQGCYRVRFPTVERRQSVHRAIALLAPVPAQQSIPCCQGDKRLTGGSLPHHSH